MDRPSTEPAGPKDAGARGSAARPKSRRSSFASRLFGYDIFLSFALGPPPRGTHSYRSEEHTSELQSLRHLVCRLLLEKKKQDRLVRQNAAHGCSKTNVATILGAV